VEAVRLGTIIAQDRRALGRWRAHVARLGEPAARAGAVSGTGGGGLAGAELERVVFAMSRTNSDIVAIRHLPAEG
jgi:hypothetical protein